MKYRRHPIEIESPEQLGYDAIRCNLAESSVSDIRYGDISLSLNNLVLAYGDHLGKPEFRKLLASEFRVKPNDVLLTQSAAMALFIVNTALLDKSDEVLVVRPNYSTNIEVPLAIEAKVNFIDVKFENNFEIDIEKIKSTISKSVKLISVTHPHNPTGVTLTLDKLMELIEVAESNNCFLLVDETYRELVFNEKTPLAASLSDKVISVSSVSKAYGLPGLRLGWLVTQNKKLQELFLAAKEQIIICNSVIDEEVAYNFYLKKEVYFKQIFNEVKSKFQIVNEWMQSHPHLEWVKPSGGVVSFPRFKNDKINFDQFYKILFDQFGTLVGPGHWFDIEKRYFRLGYGWPDAYQLKEGLNNIDQSINIIS